MKGFYCSSSIHEGDLFKHVEFNLDTYLIPSLQGIQQLRWLTLRLAQLSQPAAAVRAALSQTQALWCLVHVYVYTQYMYKYVYVDMCVCTYVYICKYRHTYTYTYTDACIYTQKHINKHIRARIDVHSTHTYAKSICSCGTLG